jgi:hypothetical protein
MGRISRIYRLRSEDRSDPEDLKKLAILTGLAAGIA